MLLVVVLVAALVAVLGARGQENTSAGYIARCGAGEVGAASVRPAEGQAARYVVEYCAPAAPRATSWRLDLRVLAEPRERCRPFARDLRYGQLHSISIENLESTNLTCTQICYSKPMDLMYRGCYKLTNQLQCGQFPSPHNHSYYYAENDIPGPDYYNVTSHKVKDYDQNTIVSFNWYPGHVPVTDYKMKVCRENVTTDDCVDAKANCTRPSPNVHCSLSLELGCYYMLLEHTAPWTSSGNFEELRFARGNFCYTADHGSLPAAMALPASVYWAGGGGALLVLGALAALLAWHSRLLRKLPRLQQRVLDYWLTSRPAGAEPKVRAAAVPACAGAGDDDGDGDLRILLVYARDCAPAQRAVAALSDLLQLVAPGQVYDMFSEEVSALAGAAPHAWVRAALAARAVRVVLVQTPALRALHATNLAATAAQDDDMRLEEPLLPRCVMYRVPHFGDTLAQYALRLMAETAHASLAPAAAPPPYHKYYIATLSELPAETFPTVVPYRRYELPAAAGVLLRDLAPARAPAPPPAALAQLDLAASELAAFVRDNPNYLTDELLFL